MERELFLDWLTGRLPKFAGFWEASAPIQFSTDSGPIILSPAVTTTDDFITVAPNGSVTFNALAGSSGESGSFEIDDGDCIVTDYGDLDIDYATGMVTYRPLSDVSNQTDYRYLFIRSVRDTGATVIETSVYGTKRVSFLIKDDATLAAPVHLTDYLYAPSTDELTFEVQLSQSPQTGGRQILANQYKADEGANCAMVIC